MPRIAVFAYALVLSLVYGSAGAFDLMTFPAGGPGVGALAMPAKGARLAQVNGTALLAAQPGAAVALTSPAGMPYTYVLDRKMAQGVHSVTWSGVMQGRSSDYRMLLTYSPGASFGRFVTPEGNLVLETVGNQVMLVDPRAAGGRQFVSATTDARPPPRRNQPRSAAAPSVPNGQPTPQATPTPQTTIDVLVLYSPGLPARIGSVAGALARIDFLVALANQAYVDSEIAITLRLLQATQINGVADNTDNDTELVAITDGTGVYSGVQALRDAIGADMVTLIRPFLETQVNCGNAWIGGFDQTNIALDDIFGYSVVSDGRDPPTGASFSFCPDTTYPHELGHNMGSLHDRLTEAGKYPPYGAYPYAFGYGVNNSFTTIMAYGTPFNDPPALAKFSNPNLLCMGVPCGVSQFNPTQSADDALTLNNTRAAVARWRGQNILAASSEPQVQAVNAGGFPVVRWFSYSPRANRSYELQLLNVTSTTNLTAAGNVARFDAAGANQLQDSTCLDPGCTTRTLRWIASADSDERLRVGNSDAAPDASSTYTVQFRETTLYCPRWSEAGGQSSILAAQRASDEPGNCNANAYFFDESGTQIGTQAYVFAANKVNVQPLSGIAGLPGGKGSMLIAHTCGIGGLKGTVIALESATGFSFGTPCGERSR